MSINAEVQKSSNESSLSVIRKFSRRVQGTGLIKLMRNRRYFARGTSKTVKKKRALKLLKRRVEYYRRIKEGRIVEPHIRTMSSSTMSRREASSRFGESTPIAR